MVLQYSSRKNCFGGILSYGIPEFRLSYVLVKKVVQSILDLGVKARTKCRLGEDISLDELKEKYDAVFLAVGANISAKMNIPGENLEGVFGGNELLRTKKHPDYVEKRVAVIGGGNVAMDVARTAIRMGAKEVYLIYRRAEEQMPAEQKEIDMAKKEGVSFLLQTNITQIRGESSVKQISCIKTELVQKEGEQRAYPVNIERK